MMLRMRLRRVGRMTGGRSEVEFIIAIWIDVSDETLVLKKIQSYYGGIIVRAAIFSPVQGIMKDGKV